MEKTVIVKEGVLFVDGAPTFLISGDYPYYRDDPSVWSDRLDKMREIGIGTVTCYIPWRHHVKMEEDGTIANDFSGQTWPSTDVARFVSLVKEKGMYMIAKPGPFIHAETRYGGLPDFVSPKKNKEIVPSTNAWGYKNKWFFMLGEPLPSALEEPYLSLVKEYMEQVAKNVLAGSIYPDGPIIAIQILNEGIYSQGSISLDNFEYSPAAKRLYHSFLEARYGSEIGKYNSLHGTAWKGYSDIPLPKPGAIKKIREARHLLAVQDWGRFATTYYNAVMDAFMDPIKRAEPNARNIPVLINTNPPLTFKDGTDIFLSRMVPEEMHACYGYTNWVGPVPTDDLAWAKYALMVKRAKGMNLEENWGFSKYYDKIYKHGHVSYYQTLLAMAFGTTGFNVYTAVGTSTWPEELDKASPPYPASAPIDENGATTPKAELVKVLSWLFGPESDLGGRLATARPPGNIVLGLHLPSAFLHAWIGNDAGTWQRTGISQPAAGEHFFTGFYNAMEELGHDFTVVNLEDNTAMKPLKTNKTMLFLACNGVLGRQIQDDLKEIVEHGGTVVMAGKMPDLGDDFTPCQAVKEFITRLGVPTIEMKAEDDFQRPFVVKAWKMKEGPGQLVVIEGNPFERLQDKNEKKFKMIERVLKGIFRFTRQAHHAAAEQFIPFKFMDDQYTKNLLPFSAPVLKEVFGHLGIEGVIKNEARHAVAFSPTIKGLEDATLQRSSIRILSRQNDGQGGTETNFIFIFSRADESKKAQFSMKSLADGHSINVKMNVPPRSAHVLVLEGGRLRAFILNGRVGFNNTAEPVSLSLDGLNHEKGVFSIEMRDACDLAGQLTRERVHIEAINSLEGTEKVRITMNGEDRLIDGRSLPMEDEVA